MPATGYFGTITKRKVRRFQRSRGLTADGIVGPMTRAKFRPRKRRTATWYGPGLYGNEMACGGKLTPNTFGVAHKTLPCGKKVAIAHGGPDRDRARGGPRAVRQGRRVRPDGEDGALRADELHERNPRQSLIRA